MKKTYTTYYIRSTGEIVGPNKGVSIGKTNKERLAFGNLFRTKTEAKAYKDFIKFHLKDNKASLRALAEKRRNND